MRAREAKRQKSLKRKGRKSFQATRYQRERVQKMIECGITQDDVARCLGITKHTLEKHFRKELDTAKPEAVKRVASKLLQIATGEDESADAKTVVAAGQFYLERQGGWTPKQRNEVTGADGGPVQVNAPVIFIPQESED